MPVAFIVLVAFFGLMMLPPALMSVKLSKNTFECRECGHTFTRKWYQILKKFGKNKGAVLLECPNCNKNVYAAGEQFHQPKKTDLDNNG